MDFQAKRRVQKLAYQMTGFQHGVESTGSTAAFMKDRHGGWLLVQCLLQHNVHRVFAVPGESYLAVLDGLYEAKSVQVVVCRQEGGCAMMAEADGKLTGRPGVAMVTRAPGATNASAGVHIAFQDSTPMILFVGQVGTGMVDREAFQEVDYRRMFGPGVGLAKAAFQIDHASRIPEYINRAFALATSGRPGPIVLALPEDMLTSSVGTCISVPRPARALVPAPAHASIKELGDLLHKARRPLILAGGGGFWDHHTCANLANWATAWKITVVAAFRRQDVIDNRHPCYAGHLGIGPDPNVASLVRLSDLLIVVGARLGEMTSQGYSLVDIPQPKHKFVHVHPDGDELNAVYTATLPIHSTPSSFLQCILEVLPCPCSTPSWAADTAQAHSNFQKYCLPIKLPGRVQLCEIVAFLNRVLPPNSILTNGAGNYSGFLHRYYTWKGVPGTQLAPTSGSMGYGLPAAVAAKLRHPDSPVVCFAGDGCFLMHGQEFMTAVMYKAAIVVLVINNGMFGTIRMHQEREFPGRVSGTSMDNPDFAALARAYGGHGETVLTTAEFEPAWNRATTSGLPSIIEIALDPEALTASGMTITKLRESRLVQQQG